MYMYIYIYIHVCVCVCVYECQDIAIRARRSTQGCGFPGRPYGKDDGMFATALGPPMDSKTTVAAMREA